MAAVIARTLFALVIMAAGLGNTNAQVLDAVRGHVEDLKARLSDHKRVDGQVLKRGEIDTKAKGQDPIHNSSGTWLLVRSGDQLFHQYRGGRHSRDHCHRHPGQPVDGDDRGVGDHQTTGRLGGYFCSVHRTRRNLGHELRVHARVEVGLGLPDGVGDYRQRGRHPLLAV